MRLKKQQIWHTFLAIIMIFGISVFAILYYMFNIEPFSLTTEILQIENSQAATSADNLRIVLFSDLHLKKDYPAAVLDSIVEQINAANPDVVIFAGDLYDDYDVYHDDEAVVAALSSIQSTYGKLAVWGNRDYGGGAEKVYVNLLDRSGFTLLQNANWYIPLDNGKTVLFTGIDDAMLGHPAMPEATRTYDSDYDILVLHDPGEYTNYLDWNYDLALAGHTHGGQIRLPGLDVLASDRQQTFLSGLYVQPAPIFVTSGLGTTHISARFRVPPVISVLDLPI